MTSIELLQRVLRHTTQPDISNAPADLLLTALEKTNESLLEVYLELPPVYREGEEGFQVRKPESVLVSTTAGSKTVSGDDVPFKDYQLGCSLLISGDTRPNTITARTEVLLPATSTLTNTAATIYFDAIGLERLVERIVSDPRLLDPLGQSGATNDIILKRWEKHRFNRVPWGLGTNFPIFNADYYVGQPWIYRIQPNRSSNPRDTANIDPCAFIRIFPWPAREYRITLDAIWSPPLLTMADWKTPITLPMKNRLAEAFLGALVESKMIATRYWAAHELDRDIREEAARTRRTMLLQPSDYAIPNATWATAPGF